MLRVECDRCVHILEKDKSPKELSTGSNLQIAEEQSGNNPSKKQTDLNPDYFFGRW